jgi:hypothetical protein
MSTRDEVKLAIGVYRCRRVWIGQSISHILKIGFSVGWLLFLELKSLRGWAAIRRLAWISRQHLILLLPQADCLVRHQQPIGKECSCLDLEEELRDVMTAQKEVNVCVSSTCLVKPRDMCLRSREEMDASRY